MVVSNDHEIVTAMRYRDLTRVQRLILAGEVHAGSILPDGSSLLHACAAEIQEQILPDLDFYDRYEEDDTREAADLSQETLKTICKMIDIALWLVAKGAAADTPNIFGKYVFR